MKCYNIELAEWFGSFQAKMVEREGGDWIEAGEALEVISELQRELEKLRQDNQYLKNDIAEYKREIVELKHEISYLNLYVANNENY